MSESDVIAIINRIAKRLAPRFTFGVYDVEDIKQEIFLIASDGLENYDEARPLENFLSVHIRNRLISFKRDNYYRKQEVCPNCNGAVCEACYKKVSNFNAKKNVLEPIDISSVRDEHEKNMKLECSFISQLEIAEISFLIDTYLPVEYRLDYLKMLDGIYIPKPRKQKIQQLICDIVEDYS